MVRRMQKSIDLDEWNTKAETYELKKDEIQYDRDRVYQAVCNNGGITCKELASQWGCSPNDISGRFTELKDKGFIRATGKRYLPNDKGKMYPHRVWRATL